MALAARMTNPSRWLWSGPPAASTTSGLGTQVQPTSFNVRAGGLAQLEFGWQVLTPGKRLAAWALVSIQTDNFSKSLLKLKDILIKFQIIFYHF